MTDNTLASVRLGAIAATALNLPSHPAFSLTHPSSAQGSESDDPVHSIADVEPRTGCRIEPPPTRVQLPPLHAIPLITEVRYDNQCVARHPRCYGRGHQILNLEHYLDVLE